MPLPVTIVAQSLSAMVTAISVTTVAIAWDVVSRQRIQKGSCKRHLFLAAAFFYVMYSIFTEASHRIQSKVLSTVEALYSGGATPYALIHTL